MDSISAFGDEAKDAGRYADVMAAASSNANTDVSGLGESFKMVAPVAGSLGYSLEDTAVALGLMANAGIKGSSAGTALRSALTNLASPTDQMKEEMEKLGISIKDSNGEMKPLDVLLGDLRGSFSKLSDDQKAASASTIFGKNAMAGMLSVINAGEGDFDKLTKAIADSDGVAEKMADTMQNNLSGKLTNLKSALGELAIKMYDALEPALNFVIDAVQKLVDWMNGLSEKTQLIVVSIGALVAAIGPLLLIFGPLLTAVGGLMTVLPALGPLIAALAGPIGIVAGTLAALGAAFALTRTKADESYQAQLKESEANLETAKARQEATEEITEQIDKTSELIQETKDQMEATDNLVDTFEELIEKSKLTTDEFGKFLTLQTELENTTSPQRVAELEEKMEKLRKKSGLSKDEFKRMLDANKDLTEMFPEAGEVIDDYGNKIADTTGKLREMTNAELERMQLEIYNEMVEDLQAVNDEIDDYNSLLGETVELEDSISQNKSEVRDIQKDINANEDEIQKNNEKILDLKDQQKEAGIGEWWQLQRQWSELVRQNVELEDKNKKNQKNIDTLEESLAVDEENLDVSKQTTESIGEQILKNRDNYDVYLEILERQYDINIEKGKENESIDKAIEKRKDEIKQLEDKIEREGDSNGKLQDSIDHLKTENSELGKAKGKLDDITSALDTHNSKFDKANNNLAKVNAKFADAGGLTDNNIKKADIWNDKLNKNFSKRIDIITNKDADEENRKWSKGIRKTVSLVTKGVGKITANADGTNYHTGGLSWIGEEGPELVEHNGKMNLTGFGLYDLPVGAKVHTYEDSVDMLRDGLVSGIGSGLSLQGSRNNSVAVETNNKDIINVLKEQNELLLGLLKKENVAYVELEKIYQPVKRRLAEDQYSNHKRRRKG